MRFHYLRMSLSHDTKEPDQWWFVPLLYAGVCLAIAGLTITELVFGAV